MDENIIIVKYIEWLNSGELASEMYEILKENGCGNVDRTITYKEKMTGAAETHFVYEMPSEDFPMVPHLEQLLSPIKQIISISIEKNV